MEYSNTTLASRAVGVGDRDIVLGHFYFLVRGEILGFGIVTTDYCGSICQGCFHESRKISGSTTSDTVLVHKPCKQKIGGCCQHDSFSTMSHEKSKSLVFEIFFSEALETRTTESSPCASSQVPSLSHHRSNSFVIYAWVKEGRDQRLIEPSSRSLRSR